MRARLTASRLTRSVPSQIFCGFLVPSRFEWISCNFKYLVPSLLCCIVSSFFLQLFQMFIRSVPYVHCVGNIAGRVDIANYIQYIKFIIYFYITIYLSMYQYYNICQPFYTYNIRMFYCSKSFLIYLQSTNNIYTSGLILCYYTNNSLPKIFSTIINLLKSYYVTIITWSIRLIFFYTFYND